MRKKASDSARGVTERRRASAEDQAGVNEVTCGAGRYGREKRYHGTCKGKGKKEKEATDGGGREGPSRTWGRAEGSLHMAGHWWKGVLPPGHD
jgi:hypothetical protein